MLDKTFIDQTQEKIHKLMLELAEEVPELSGLVVGCVWHKDLIKTNIPYGFILTRPGLSPGDLTFQLGAANQTWKLITLLTGAIGDQLGAAEQAAVNLNKTIEDKRRELERFTEGQEQRE